MQESTGLDWDDLRFVLAVANAGSLARAARALGVDHTTVGRRVEAAERALGLRIFVRSPGGFVLTRDGDRLLTPMRGVAAAVLGVTRAADQVGGGLTGAVRVTSPETFGVSYLAPRLAAFGRLHPGLEVELMPSGRVLDLARGEAELAVRFFRTRAQSMVVKRVGELRYGLYASRTYVADRPFTAPEALSAHPLLLPPGPARSPETAWLARWAPGVRPAFASELSAALLGAAKAHAGLVVLPCFLADVEPELVRLPLPDPPEEGVWLTVHEDVRNAPRVRALMEFLSAQLRGDRALLRGESVGE